MNASVWHLHYLQLSSVHYKHTFVQRLAQANVTLKMLCNVRGHLSRTKTCFPDRHVTAGALLLLALSCGKPMYVRIVATLACSVRLHRSLLRRPNYTSETSSTNSRQARLKFDKSLTCQARAARYVWVSRWRACRKQFDTFCRQIGDMLVAHAAHTVT